MNAASVTLDTLTMEQVDVWKHTVIATQLMVRRNFMELSNQEQMEYIRVVEATKNESEKYNEHLSASQMT